MNYFKYKNFHNMYVKNYLKIKIKLLILENKIFKFNNKLIYKINNLFNYYRNKKLI